MTWKFKRNRPFGRRRGGRNKIKDG